MPRTVEANQRIREEQRARILRAALIVFARKGMTATMGEVAAAADVSYGLVYRYFANKEVLLAELIEGILPDSVRTIELILALPGTPGERLRALLSQILQVLREHPEFVLLTQKVLNDDATSHYLREVLQQQDQTYYTMMRQLIVAGQATGEVAGGNPDQLVTAVSACIAGLSQGLTRLGSEHFKEHFPDIEIILRLITP